MNTELGRASSHRALSLLEEGISLANQGQRDEARALFRRVIQSELDNEDAWLWLSWVAESPQASLRCLLEAKAFLPESERVDEAIRWVKRKMGDETPEPSPAGRSGRAKSAVRARERERKVTETAHQAVARSREAAARVEDAAYSAQEQATRILGRVSDSMGSMSSPRLQLGRLQKLVVPVLSILCVAALFMFVMLGIANARREPQVVLALELPTPVADATATPTFEQRTRPLWVKADVAWTRQDWEGVIGALTQVREVDGQNQECRERLAEAYYYRGLARVEANDLDGAQADLDQAIRLNAANEDLQEVRRILDQYMTGLHAYWEKDWSQAVSSLKLVHKKRPGFRDTRVMLSEAYYQIGQQREQDEVWVEALDAYEMALELEPERQDAQARAVAVNDILVPPKRIVVDISAKIVTLYQNHEPIHVFPVCTGRAAAPTVPGRYEVQTLLPEAYASKWDLRMPWWVGIYWAGGSENGFHALPILSNGQILWRSALGTGCSYGCIVLDTEDAKFLYDWAELGDTVIVNP
jgi:tetratricopeptide (TPR) repeat protein